jgi:hypothetical protein
VPTADKTLTLMSSKFHTRSVESTPHHIIGIPQTKRRVVLVCEML